MNKQITDEIKNIVEKIVEKKSVEKIILFGSYARGDETHDSDIDLCIITNNQEKVKLTWHIREAIFDVAQHSVDLVMYNQNEFTERAISDTTLESQILKTGVVLYG